MSIWVSIQHFSSSQTQWHVFKTHWVFSVHALCAHGARQWLSVHTINICRKYVNMGVNKSFLKLINTMACLKNTLGNPCVRSVCSQSRPVAERSSVHATNIFCKYVNMGVNSAFPKLTNTMACLQNTLCVLTKHASG